ncbi:MAG: hypothetical protein KDA28_01770, partial [Phycisphaerales bacterium]|nr:hypothetical protein [Phycisphaerales bacterium]
MNRVKCLPNRIIAPKSTLDQNQIAERGVLRPSPRAELGAQRRPLLLLHFVGDVFAALAPPGPTTKQKEYQHHDDGPESATPSGRRVRNRPDPLSR